MSNKNAILDFRTKELQKELDFNVGLTRHQYLKDIESNIEKLTKSGHLEEMWYPAIEEELDKSISRLETAKVIIKQIKHLQSLKD